MQENVKNVYEYMLLYLAYDYIVNKNQEKENLNGNASSIFEAFNNSKNDFSSDKRTLLPFLVTIGNGKKYELLSLFHPFVIINNIGFKSLAILENGSKIFTYNNDNLKINNEFIAEIKSIDDNDKHSTFKSISETIFKFNNVDVIHQQNIKESYSHINTSIDNINRKIPKFANETFEDVSYWSKLNTVYSIYNEFFIDDQSLFDNDIVKKLNLNILIHDFNLQASQTVYDNNLQNEYEKINELKLADNYSL